MDENIYVEMREYPGMPVTAIKMLSVMEENDEDNIFLSINPDFTSESQEVLNEFLDFQRRYPSELLKKCSQIVMESQGSFLEQDWLYYMYFLLMELQEKYDIKNSWRQKD